MAVTDQRVPLWQDLEQSNIGFRWHMPERFNLGRNCADEQPMDDLALIVDDNGTVRRYTFGDLAERSDRLVSVLRDLGVQRGDRLGIMAPQGVEVAIAHLACYKAGCIAVPLSVQFGPDALVYRLSHCAVRALVIYVEGFDRLQDSLNQLPELGDVLLVTTAENAGAGSCSGTVSTRRTVDSPRVIDFASAIAAAEPTADVLDTAPDDPALLLYTSGTTGPPKGVLHRHQIVLAQMPGLRLSHDMFPQPGDIFWTPSDWAWGGALFDTVLSSWLCGRPVVASPRKFDATWAYELMARHQVRNCFLPPTALKQMRRAGPPPDEVALRTIASGGEALGESVLAWAQEHLGVVVNEFYGQTEANLMLGNGPGQGTIRPGSMGRPYPGFDLALLDADDKPVAAGEQGEIALRLPHPGAFIEYWRQPERTAEKMRGDWLFTGDLATCDEDGYFWFAGRADDIIISGGYRIGPTEIEECLISHPGVLMAAVIGVPDELRGEAVSAFVVPAEGAHADDRMSKELQDHVKHRLAFYQYPRAIRFVQELPMTTTGKIQRAELRRRAAAEQHAKQQA